MTSEPMLLDPEVEELLREVAADPDSALLRVPREKAVRTLYEDVAAAGPVTSGLSAAELEILRVHRLELAWLLRQACVTKLVNGVNTRSFVGSYLTAKTRVTSVMPSEMPDTTHPATWAQASDSAWLRGCRLLEDAIAGPARDVPTILDLALAAHRLEPSHDSRVLASQYLALAHSSRSAIAALRPVLASVAGSRISVCAWTTLGLARNKQGQLVEAHLAYRSAAHADEGMPIPWLDYLALSFQVGKAEAVMHAARHLEGLIAPDHELLYWFVESRRQRRAEGEWAPTIAAVDTWNILRNQIGPVGRRVGDVFA